MLHILKSLFLHIISDRRLTSESSIIWWFNLCYRWTFKNFPNFDKLLVNSTTKLWGLTWLIFDCFYCIVIIFSCSISFFLFVKSNTWKDSCDSWWVTFNLIPILRGVCVRGLMSLPISLLSCVLIICINVACFIFVLSAIEAISRILLDLPWP
jgi:hypothetical protein